MAVELVRFILSHLLAGCFAGIVAAVVTVATNVGSLRDLMFNVDGGWLAFAMLTFGFATTFGSAAMAHGIMRIGEQDD
jgi:hypothetical protein